MLKKEFINIISAHTPQMKIGLYYKTWLAKLDQTTQFGMYRIVPMLNRVNSASIFGPGPELT